MLCARITWVAIKWNIYLYAFAYHIGMLREQQQMTIQLDKESNEQTENKGRGWGQGSLSGTLAIKYCCSISILQPDKDWECGTKAEHEKLARETHGANMRLLLLLFTQASFCPLESFWFEFSVHKINNLLYESIQIVILAIL